MNCSSPWFFSDRKIHKFSGKFSITVGEKGLLGPKEPLFYGKCTEIYQWKPTQKLLNFYWKLNFSKITGDFTRLIYQEILKGLDFWCWGCALSELDIFVGWQDRHKKSLVIFQRVNQQLAPRITGPGDWATNIMHSYRRRLEYNTLPSGSCWAKSMRHNYAGILPRYPS